MELNQEQSDVIFCRKPQQVVIAGPGSGKTRTLCAKIANLLREQTDPRRIFVVTFTNAAAGEIVRRLPEGSNVGYCGTLHGLMLRMINAAGNVNLAVADEDHSEMVLRKVIKEIRYKGTIEAARQEIKRDLPFKRRYTDPERVAIAYYAELNGAGLIDFDGILNMGLKTVRSWMNPERIEWLFVDEAQDCADIDFKIFLAMRIPQKVYIGDPDQAIYSFRGGNVGNFLNLAIRAGEDEVAFPKDQTSQVFTLKRNYRCRSMICKRAQQLIENNSQRYPKETIADQLGGVVAIDGFGHPFEELAFICDRINAGKLDHGKQCAILYRTNHLAKQAADYLLQAGIQVARKSTEKLPEDWFRARTAINLLNSPENDTLARLYLSLTVGERETETIHFDALQAYKSINQHFLRWPRLDGVTGSIQIPEFLIKQKISMDSVALIRSAIEKLPPSGSISDLILGLGADLHHIEEVGEGVTVTTMHSAKGREWSVVFLPAFEAGTIPSSSGQSKFWDKSVEAIEEERRLAYVAMTRAKDALSISYCDMRQGEFDRMPVKRRPSPFLYEAGLLLA